MAKGRFQSSSLTCASPDLPPGRPCVHAVRTTHEDPRTRYELYHAAPAAAVAPPAHSGAGAAAPPPMTSVSPPAAAAAADGHPRRAPRRLPRTRPRRHLHTFRARARGPRGFRLRRRGCASHHLSTTESGSSTGSCGGGDGDAAPTVRLSRQAGGAATGQPLLHWRLIVAAARRSPFDELQSVPPGSRAPGAIVQSALEGGTRVIDPRPNARGDVHDDAHPHGKPPGVAAISTAGTCSSTCLRRWTRCGARAGRKPPRPRSPPWRRPGAGARREGMNGQQQQQHHHHHEPARASPLPPPPPPPPGDGRSHGADEQLARRGCGAEGSQLERRPSQPVEHGRSPGRGATRRTTAIRRRGVRSFRRWRKCCAGATPGTRTWTRWDTRLWPPWVAWAPWRRGRLALPPNHHAGPRSASTSPSRLWRNTRAAKVVVTRRRFAR